MDSTKKLRSHNSAHAMPEPGQRIAHTYTHAGVFFVRVIITAECSVAATEHVPNTVGGRELAGELAGVDSNVGVRRH